MTRVLKIVSSAFIMVLLLLTGNVAHADTYVPNVATLQAIPTSGVVTLGGYYNPGDGGGGLLYPYGSGGSCTQNFGTIFKDHHGNCLYRVKPTNSVREWRAYCDVVAVQPSPPTTTAVWNPGLVDPTNPSNVGAVVVSTSLLKPLPNAISRIPDYIAISQVGGPTLWVNGSGTAKPAMWATRFSTLSSSGTNYKRGDLVSFIGSTNSGSFSQQIAIIVDAVTPGGGIGQWHFLWGGLYDPSVAIDSPLIQDTNPGHNYLQGNPTAGAGATLTPAWSGWSVLNNQTMQSGGTNYKVGDTISMSENAALSGTMDGSVVNQKQYPELVVEATDNSGGPGLGAVTRYDWLDFGSYATLPTNLASPANPMLLTSVVSHRAGVSGLGPGSGFAISPVLWTQGPLATTIADVQPDATPGLTDIFVTDHGAFPVTVAPVPLMPIQYFYYGHDDNVAINAALNSASSASIATGNGAAFSLPAACGTTTAINLPQDTTPNFVNPSLVGGNFQSTGLYAFAAPLALRGASHVLSQVVYGGLHNAFGGGLRDMVVEGMGIPEGYGYYGLANTTSPPGPPIGYIGPSLSSATPFPTAGDAIEVISGKYIRIRNVHVSDGGIGSGNAAYQCGIDESDPAMVLGVNGVGNSVISDSRFDANPLFSGATNPDVALRLDDSCHDTTYKAVSAYDGVKADVMLYNGNLFSQLHVGSSAFGAGAGLADPLLVFVTTGAAANTGFAGVADYGVYSIGNISLAQTRCDIANHACVYLDVSNDYGLSNPGQITDTQMRCGSLRSVPPNYVAVEMGAGAGAVDATIGGTAAASQCNVPGAQLVISDGVFDPTISLCNNANSPATFCAGYRSGFASGRYYTQPSLGYSTLALTGASTNTPLYAIPFVNPTGGVITQIGIQVTTPGSTSSMCELGIYASKNGAPGPLLLDAGAKPVSGIGPQIIVGLNFTIQPGALYFLVAACNAPVTVEATASTNGLAGLLMGEPDFLTYGATAVTGIWPTFAVGQLPAAFGALTYATVAGSTPVPNVYVGS